jgi:hypothetical protein
MLYQEKEKENKAIIFLSINQCSVQSAVFDKFSELI